MGHVHCSNWMCIKASRLLLCDHNCVASKHNASDIWPQKVLVSILLHVMISLWFVNLPTARSTPPEGGRLTPATLSANQEILEYLAPHLQMYLHPMALLPYLQRHALVDSSDVDYICNPHRTDDDRRWRILRHAPYKDPGAFSRFVQCLAEENVHPGHKYLARRLHEAMERKRTNPFSELIMYSCIDGQIHDLHFWRCNTLSAIYNTYYYYYYC